MSVTFYNSLAGVRACTAHRTTMHSTIVYIDDYRNQAVDLNGLFVFIQLWDEQQFMIKRASGSEF
jgi:hypothetical protein